MGDVRRIRAVRTWADLDARSGIVDLSVLDSG